MSRVRRPRVTVLVRIAAAASLVGSLALTACSGDDSSSSRPTAAPSTATYSATPLADLDTAAMVVPRAPFCDRISPEAVTSALGEQPVDVAAHRSGQRVKVSDGVADVVHEFGCRWTVGDNTAEAWVFAPPVTRERAQELAAQVRGLRACTDDTQASSFGEPFVWCLHSPSRKVKSTRVQGLFGDAWLSCSLSLVKTPEPDLTDRATRWCAAVAVGASAGG